MMPRYFVHNHNHLYTQTHRYRATEGHRDADTWDKLIRNANLANAKQAEEEEECKKTVSTFFA